MNGCYGEGDGFIVMDAASLSLNKMPVEFMQYNVSFFHQCVIVQGFRITLMLSPS